MRGLRAGFFLPGCFILLIAPALHAQQNDSLYLNNILIAGNKRTKQPIVTRELTIVTGRYYRRAELELKTERSRQNLMNTSLFNFVDILPAFHGDTVDITIKLTERWYTWPSPIFELVDPNFNTWWETRDISRTSFGLQLTQYNMRGRNETLRARFKYGYNEQYSLAYEIPFIDRKKIFGMGIYTYYAQNYQVTYGTEQNKRLFYTDAAGVAREEFSVSTRLQYRKANYGRHFLGIKYNEVTIPDTLSEIAPGYLGNGQVGRKTIELYYQYSFDKRDYSPYPLSGRFYTASITKPDIDLGQPSHNGIFQLYGQMKRYFPINSELYYAFSTTAKHTFFKGQLPYYFQRGLGYNDFVRGYEYYVIDAQSFLALKSNFKIRLLKSSEVRIGFIRNERFNRLFFAGYLNFNADAGYAADRQYAENNPLANVLLLGGGIGLDVISFYDVVVRFEYSFNKLGQSGFFLHFSKPI